MIRRESALATDDAYFEILRYKRSRRLRCSWGVEYYELAAPEAPYSLRAAPTSAPSKQRVAALPPPSGRRRLGAARLDVEISARLLHSRATPHAFMPYNVRDARVYYRFTLLMFWARRLRCLQGVSHAGGDIADDFATFRWLIKLAILLRRWPRPGGLTSFLFGERCLQR